KAGWGGKARPAGREAAGLANVVDGRGQVGQQPVQAGGGGRAHGRLPSGPAGPSAARAPGPPPAGSSARSAAARPPGQPRWTDEIRDRACSADRVASASPPEPGGGTGRRVGWDVSRS